MKIIIISGARPNFIKSVPLLNAFKQHRKIQSIIINTGQHYDLNMSNIFLENIAIDYDLGIGSGTHGWQTGSMMQQIEPIIIKEDPSSVVVFGDTNSTLAGALTAAKLHIPVIHIESGLRSFNKTMPEEINRIITDHISTLLFCPSPCSVINLQNEGITKNVYDVGDIMYDSFKKNIKEAECKSKILKKLCINTSSYLLLTMHRACNVDSPETVKKILEAIHETGIPIIFPVHPRTASVIANTTKNKLINIRFIDPVKYLDMIWLEKNAYKVLTDSGGIQKEAFWAGVPCITLREETEWGETVKIGWNTLVGTDTEKLINAIKYFQPTGKLPKIYGDGSSGQQITDIILKMYDH